jgi:hypothetical protein
MNNPALQQEARYEPAAVIPLKQESSLIDWLKARNRLIAREAQELEGLIEDDGELDDVIGSDDYYDDDTDYDDDDLEVDVEVDVDDL